MRFSVEAGSNIFAIALWVEGSDEMEVSSLETVKYDGESHGTRTRE
jgi:hypothetical protein